MNNGIHKIDYSLTGVESKNAKKKGLADAQWYLPPVSKKEMKKLLERRDLPAILDTDSLSSFLFPVLPPF